MKEIDVYFKLNGRTGEEHVLLKKPEGWLFITDHSIRVIYDSDKLVAIDPVGGPFIGIGDEIRDNVIKEFKIIDNKLYIVFDV